MKDNALLGNHHYILDKKVYESSCSSNNVCFKHKWLVLAS